jgi:predicted PurR-regulated permease PerM
MSISTDRERIATLGFYGLAVLFGYLVYQLFRPFLVPLAWAGVLVICFYPTHERLERRLGPGRAALLSTISVALLVILPLLAVGSAFVSETAQLLGGVPRLLAQTPDFAQRRLQMLLQYVPGGERIDVPALVGESARRLASFVSVQAAGIVGEAVVFIAYLALTILAMFFLFRDAPIVMRGIRRIMPFDEDVRERLIDQTRTLVTASVSSGLTVAAVQGLLGGLSFWILGLSAPVFWGVVIAIVCLLPFGAWVVWAPAAVWLIATGSIVRGLLLVSLGLGIVSGVDNFLRPLLLSGRSEMNGLLLFISLLGGVAAFGMVGLVAGPVLMATAVALFEVFTTDAGSSAEAVFGRGRTPEHRREDRHRTGP